MVGDQAYEEVLRRLDEQHTALTSIASMAAGNAQASELSFGKQGVTLKSFQMNTFLTFVSMLMSLATACGLYLMYQEQQQTSKALIQALGQQTKALERNICLQSYRGDEAQKEDFCKRMSDMR